MMTTRTPAKPRGPQDVGGCSLKSETVIGELESTVTDVPTELLEVLQAETCVHHWMIAPADGCPTSKGVCKYCGEEREFHNCWDEEAAKERSNFLLNYKRWDSVYERDHDEEFVRGLRQYGNQDY